MNQLRQKIGVVYGNPEITTGGNALKFYCSVRLDIRRKKPLEQSLTMTVADFEGAGGRAAGCELCDEEEADQAGRLAGAGQRCSTRCKT